LQRPNVGEQSGFSHRPAGLERWHPACCAGTVRVRYSGQLTGLLRPRVRRRRHCCCRDAMAAFNRLLNWQGSR